MSQLQWKLLVGDSPLLKGPSFPHLFVIYRALLCLLSHLKSLFVLRGVIPLPLRAARLRVLAVTFSEYSLNEWKCEWLNESINHRTPQTGSLHVTLQMSMWFTRLPKSIKPLADRPGQWLHSKISHFTQQLLSLMILFYLHETHCVCLFKTRIWS